MYYYAISLNKLILKKKSGLHPLTLLKIIMSGLVPHFPMLSANMEAIE